MCLVNHLAILILESNVLPARRDPAAMRGSPKLHQGIVALQYSWHNYRLP
jgi:hypothetical protein